VLELVKAPRVELLQPLRRQHAFNADNWIFDLKYDGFRGSLRSIEGRSEFVSKNGYTMKRFRSFAAQVAAELQDEVVLDGEIVAVDATERPIFLDLYYNRPYKLKYIVFDVMWMNGFDVRDMHLVERREALPGILPNNSKIIAEAISIDREGLKLFQSVCDHDLEGIVAKPLDSTYFDAKWLKILNRLYTQKKDRYKLFAKRRRT
jgi:bifunctional non-homologous end joining protein LigD